MGSPVGWDNRDMFELYVCDYFRKNGMHETAEIFRREVNLKMDPASLPVNVPGGFLLEWWLTFYDMFRAWQPRNFDRNSSYMVEQVINARQQCNFSSLREHEMAEEMIRELIDANDFAFASEPPIGGHLETENVSQNSMPSQPEQKSLTPSKRANHEDNLGDTVAQEVGPSTRDIVETENDASDKTRRKGTYFSCSKGASQAVPEANSFSKIESPILKSFNDIVKDEGNTSGNTPNNGAPSETNTSNGKSLNAGDDSKNEESTSSGNSLTNHETLKGQCFNS
ncbi:hypothetical protein NMG60_11034167 [Bertholletia excelsa]